MWNIVELWWWDVECITLPLHLAPHHITTTFYIAPFHIKHHLWHIPNHTTVHITPSFLTMSHISYRTSTSRSTLYHFAIPYFKSHRIGHIMHHTTDISHCTPFRITDVPYNATFHVLHATLISHHILATSLMHRTTTSRITPHFTQHCTIFHNPYYTTTFHNPIPIWETRNYMWSVLLHSFIHIKPFIPHMKSNTKLVVKKCNFIHKVPETVIPVCPNTVLSGSLFNPNIAYKDGWSEPAVLGENDCCFSSSSFFLLTPSVCRTDMLHLVANCGAICWVGAKILWEEDGF